MDSPAGTTLKSCLIRSREMIWWLDQRKKIQIFGSRWCAACNCGCGFDLIVQWRQWNQSFNRFIYSQNLLPNGVRRHIKHALIVTPDRAPLLPIYHVDNRAVLHRRGWRQRKQITVMPGFVFLNLFCFWPVFMRGEACHARLCPERVITVCQDWTLLFGSP